MIALQMGELVPLTVFFEGTFGARSARILLDSPDQVTNGRNVLDVQVLNLPAFCMWVQNILPSNRRGGMRSDGMNSPSSLELPCQRN